MFREALYKDVSHSAATFQKAKNKTKPAMSLHHRATAVSHERFKCSAIPSPHLNTAMDIFPAWLDFPPP